MRTTYIIYGKEAADEFSLAMYLLSFYVEVLIQRRSVFFPLPRPMHFTALSCSLSSTLSVASTDWINELAKRLFGEMENCRRHSEFFMRKYEEFLTTHKIRSEGIVQCAWTETLSVTLKTTTKKVLLQGFFSFQSYLVPVCSQGFPKKTHRRH